MKHVNKYCTTVELQNIKHGDVITNGSISGIVDEVEMKSLAWGLAFIFKLTNNKVIKIEI